MNESDEQPRISGGRVARVAPLVGMAGRTAGEAVAASLRKRRHGEADLTEFHTRQAERYAERLGNSRGVLLKAGQILSMVIPESAVEGEYRGIYQQAFAQLFDNAPPMPTEVAIATIEAELGRPAPELFASFAAAPLAAASIGQVHAATLHDGTRVVVKVQYPGVEQAIRADLANTELLATFLQLILTVVPHLSRTDVRAMAREISDRIGEEIDYRAEAANQQEFANAYRGHSFIRIPEVHDDLTTRRVLTMQYVDGMRYEQAKLADQQLRDRWGEAIYRFVYDSLSRLGLSNADAHPGNYLFHQDGSVTFLDFGCVKRFTPARVETLVEFLRHVANQDADALHRYAIQNGFLRARDALDAEKLLAVFTETQPHVAAPQPFTFTPEVMAAGLRAGLNASNMQVIRKLSSPADWTMIQRLGAGTFTVLGGLRATGHWNAIWEECCEGAPPFTEYGRVDTEFWVAKL
jgi:predicted unusual protein kinase regulating ubiquinone biosynthesis (AarF/ABC1/UbiB family)